MAPEERREGKRLPCKLSLNWDDGCLREFVLGEFPRIAGSYTLARAAKNKTLEPLAADVNTPAKLKRVLGRSTLYIIPNYLKVRKYKTSQYHEYYPLCYRAAAQYLHHFSQ